MIQVLLIEAEMGGPNGRIYADTLSTALATHFVNHYSIERSGDFPGLQPLDQQRCRV